MKCDHKYQLNYNNYVVSKVRSAEVSSNRLPDIYCDQDDKICDENCKDHIQNSILFKENSNGKSRTY